MLLKFKERVLHSCIYLNKEKKNNFIVYFIVLKIEFEHFYRYRQFHLNHYSHYRHHFHNRLRHPPLHPVVHFH